MRHRRRTPPIVVGGRGPVPRCRTSDLRSEAGFSLAEALTAVAILTIALAGLLTTMSSGFVGVDGARRSSTALFLAEQRMEQVKAVALSKAAGAGQGWVNVTTAQFPAEGYNTIPGYPGYRRAVAVTDNPGGLASTKLVEVRTFYRPVTTAGQAAETSVVLTTLLAPRS